MTETSGVSTSGRLHRLLSPRSIAIVGASPSPGGPRQALTNLLEGGFAGRVAAVNPRYGDVLGVPCVPRLIDLDFVPDAVFVGLRPADSLPVVREAAELGAGGAVVVASGFAEAGPEGRALQDELRRVALDAGMPVIGPNCQGIINFGLPASLYMRKVNDYGPGAVGLVAQSGSVTTAIVNNRFGVRMRYVVSSGNEAVTTAADLLAFFIEQPDVTTIAMFLETIREPRRFLAECDRAAAANKAVVVLKAGRTEDARLAGVSHSGALSPPDRLIDAALRAHGVLRVESLEELLGTTLAACGRRSKGNRLAAITISGGHVEMLHDQAPAAGVVFPPLEPPTVEQLRAVLPPSLHAQNPLDSWGLANPGEDFERCIEVLAADPGIDAIVVMAEPWQFPTGYPGAHQTYIDAARHLAARTDKVVILLSAVCGSNSDLADQVMQDSVLPLAGIRDGLRSLGNLAMLATSRRSAARKVSSETSDLDRELAGAGAGPVSGQAALTLLAKMGVPVVATSAAASADEAVRLARALGGSVVVKGGHEGLVHKLDAGAVRLDLGTDDEVRAAATGILDAGHGPLLVQPMLRGGAEVIAGVLTDPELGSFVLLGAGGSWAEQLGDTALLPVPLGEGDAMAMIKSLRMAPRLLGGRRQQPLDTASLAAALESMSDFAQRYGHRIQSLDVNPIRVLEKGVMALDAVLVPSHDPRTEPGPRATD